MTDHPRGPAIGRAGRATADPATPHAAIARAERRDRPAAAATARCAAAERRRARRTDRSDQGGRSTGRARRPRVTVIAGRAAATVGRRAPRAGDRTGERRVATRPGTSAGQSGAPGDRGVMPRPAEARGADATARASATMRGHGGRAARSPRTSSRRSRQGGARRAADAVQGERGCGRPPPCDGRAALIEDDPRSPTARAGGRAAAPDASASCARAWRSRPTRPATSPWRCASCARSAGSPARDDQIAADGRQRARRRPSGPRARARSLRGPRELCRSRRRSGSRSRCPERGSTWATPRRALDELERAPLDLAAHPPLVARRCSTRSPTVHEELGETDGGGALATGRGQRRSRCSTRSTPSRRPIAAIGDRGARCASPARRPRGERRMRRRRRGRSLTPVAPSDARSRMPTSCCSTSTASSTAGRTRCRTRVETLARRPRRGRPGRLHHEQRARGPDASVAAT